MEGKNERKEERSRERGGGRKVCWGIKGLGKGNKKGRGGRERRNILHEQRKTHKTENKESEGWNARTERVRDRNSEKERKKELFW